MCFCVILRWKSTLSKASETSKMLSNCLWDAVWPMRTHWLYPVFPLTLDERKTSCLALLVGRVESSGQIKSQKQSHFSDSGRRGKDGEGSLLVQVFSDLDFCYGDFISGGLCGDLSLTLALIRRGRGQLPLPVWWPWLSTYVCLDFCILLFGIHSSQN